jgi:hypothetical protein
MQYRRAREGGRMSKREPCRCEAYKFPHKLNSGHCREGLYEQDDVPSGSGVDQITGERYLTYHDRAHLIEEGQAE